MSVTIADKLIEAAQNEQRIYKKGYDKGVADAGGTVVNKPEVVGNYNATANGFYSYEPAAGTVFSKVYLNVAVPSDSKEEEEGVFEVLENGEYDFLPSADKVFSKVKVTVDVPSGEIEGKINVTDEFSISVYPGDASMGTLSYFYCPPTSEGGTTFTMMEINSFGFVAASKDDGLIPGDVYDVYCVPLGELWQTVVFANRDYQTLAIPSSNANIRQYARYYENEGRLRITIPPDFSGLLFINVKWTGGGCAIYKVEESEGGGTDDGSYDEGYNDGYTDGFEDGKAEGGDDTYYNEMWDEIQQDGTRTDYTRVFMGAGWNDKSFQPKYPLKPQKAQAMFEYSGTLSNEFVKSIDFSECGVIMGCFRYSNVVELGVIDCRKVAPGWNGMLEMFYSANLLRKIEKLILPENSQCKVDAFPYCGSLEEITLEGTAYLGMNFRHSTKLNKASLTSIVNCLATTTSGIALTLSITAVNKAFETSSGANDGSTSAEWTALVATRSNWTISLL